MALSLRKYLKNIFCSVSLGITTKRKDKPENVSSEIQWDAGQNQQMNCKYIETVKFAKRRYW